MKKIIAVLLLIAFSFSLCACGTATVTAVHEQAVVEEVPAEVAPTPEPAPSRGDLLYEKYSDVLDALEAEDYDSAMDSIAAMKPVPTPPPVTAVDITLDNYLDYFEIATKDYDQNDAYGNLYYRNREYYLELKDRYSCDPDNPGEITVGFEYDEMNYTYRGLDFDFETFTSPNKLKYKPSKLSRSESESSYMWYDEEHSRAILRCHLYGDIAAVEQQYNDSWSVIASNLEIVNIKGTIYLLDN